MANDNDSLHLNYPLKNNYSVKILYKLIHSNDLISEKAKHLIYGDLLLFIGIEDETSSKIISQNLDCIRKGTLPLMFQ
jgi:hypothetical protein